MLAEYRRLTRPDEETTLSALARSRAIIDACIAGHRGRIASTAGNSVLAEFPSAAEALSCALAIQPAIASGHGILGATLVFSGSPREGLVALQRGIRLDLRDPLERERQSGRIGPLFLS